MFSICKKDLDPPEESITSCTSKQRTRKQFKSTDERNVLQTYDMVNVELFLEFVYQVVFGNAHICQRERGSTSNLCWEYSQPAFLNMEVQI
jgi:hypothetical protein